MRVPCLSSAEGEILKRSGFKRPEKMNGETFSRKSAPARKTVAKPSQKDRATNVEREHMARVAAMGCCLCIHLGYGGTPAEVHHVRVKGGWGRSGNMNTIGLCPEHHRGQPGGVHDMGREQFAAHYGISEIELLNMVNEKLGVI